jgi:hypothetical protein
MIKLTPEQIDKVWNSMPGGAEGFLKGWGYQQFAVALQQSLGEERAKIAYLEIPRELVKKAALHLYEYSQEYNHIAPRDLVPDLEKYLEDNPEPEARAKQQMEEFETLLEDLEGAVAETAVFNATRRSMTVRMVRPRREKLVAFVLSLLKKKRMKIVGYVMKHKTGPDQGFMWLSERNSKLFSEDWTRVPAYIEVENNETKADA